MSWPRKATCFELQKPPSVAMAVNLVGALCMCMWVHATRLLGTTAAAQEHEWFEGFDWNALQVCWEESPNETKAKHAMREAAACRKL